MSSLPPRRGSAVPEQDPLTTTIAELRSLRSRDRRFILAALDPADRARAAALLREGREAAPRQAQVEAPPTVSPWLLDRLEAVDERVSPAAKRALAEALEADVGAPASPPRGRTLLGAVAALLGFGGTAL